MTTLPEILNAAADHIATFGHHKGDAYADPTNYRTSPACTLGAIGAVYDEEQAVYDLAADAVNSYLGRRPFAIPGWNDAPERTASEVVEVLRAAAIIEAAKLVDVQVVTA